MAVNRFDRAAAAWDDNPERMAVTRAIARAIRQDVPLSSELSMLDFGCGTANLSVLLADSVGHIQAVDTSAGMIAEVQRKLTCAPELASIIVPAAVAEPITEHLHGSWDVICTSMVLHHIEDATGTLRHLAGCVREGGWLAVADLFSEDGSFHGQKGAAHNGFDPEALSGVLKDAGLTQTRFQTATTFPKPDSEGRMREYSVFLLTAWRGACE